MKIKHEDLIGTYEQKRKLVSQFNLMDDTFFAVVLENKEACEYLLSALLNEPVKLIKNKTQYSIRNAESHSVVLDALAEDSDHRLFNVEIQIGDKNNHERRLRAYQAAIDFSCTKKGIDYKDMQDLYLIFISDFDPFGKGSNRYKIKEIVEDFEDVKYSCGVHKLYFNTEVVNNTKLSKLLQYLAHSDAANKSFGALSKAVAYHKINNKGVDTMCRAVEEYAKEYANGREEQGIIKGRIESQLKTVKSMLDDGFDLDLALKYANMSKTTYNKYTKAKPKK